MKEEKSCGAVIHKTENGVRRYLVEHTPSGKTVIPKGHVEGAETETETALREIREETNLEVELDTGFRQVARYSPKSGVMKDVVFFTAVPRTWELVPQPGEVLSLEWLPYEEARAQMTYPAVREVLEKAEQYLRTKE